MEAYTVHYRTREFAAALGGNDGRAPVPDLVKLDYEPRYMQCVGISVVFAYLQI